VCSRRFAQAIELQMVDAVGDKKVAHLVHMLTRCADALPMQEQTRF
jgi:hypothetical protein